MRFGPLTGIAAAVVVVELAGSAEMPRVLSAPTACEALARTALTNGTVISAESVPAGAFAPPSSTNAAAPAPFTTLPPDTFDKVAALDEWIASGTKPLSLVASHATAGVVDRTRPVCAYPAVARYVGSGSTDDAKNFPCQTP